MNWQNFFHSDYWFGQPLPARGFLLYLLLSCFLLLTAAGVISGFLARIARAKEKRIALKRFSRFGAVIGICGLLWLFLRQQKIIFLAWRFWLLLLAGFAVWWLVNILHYVAKRMPAIKKEREGRTEMEKYLPDGKSRI